MSCRFRMLSGQNSTEPPPEPDNVDSDFVVIFVALLCALICVLGLVAVARCTWIRRISGIVIVGRRDQSSPADANQGLKKKVLKTLPKLTYSTETTAEKFSDCAICLTEFVDGDEIRVLPLCGHGFHVACIDTWFGSHSSCPSCRQILVATPRCKKCGENQIKDMKDVEALSAPPETKDNGASEKSKGYVSYFICTRPGGGPVVLSDQIHALLDPLNGLPNSKRVFCDPTSP